MGKESEKCAVVFKSIKYPGCRLYYRTPEGNIGLCKVEYTFVVPPGCGLFTTDAITD